MFEVLTSNSAFDKRTNAKVEIIRTADIGNWIVAISHDGQLYKYNFCARPGEYSIPKIRDSNLQKIMWEGLAALGYETLIVKSYVSGD